MPFVVPGPIVKASHIGAWPSNSEIHRLFTLRNTKIWQFPVPPQSRSVPSSTSPGLLTRSIRFARSSVFHEAGMSYAKFSNNGTSWLTSFCVRFAASKVSLIPRVLALAKPVNIDKKKRRKKPLFMCLIRSRARFSRSYCLNQGRDACFSIPHRGCF